jgi:hypothetical protein
MARNTQESEKVEIDLSSLESEAKGSVAGESYRQIARGDDYRIGITINRSNNGELTYSIEFLLCVLKKKSEVNPALLERALRISTDLDTRGYVPTHENDGWIIFEKTVQQDSILSEVQILFGLLSDLGDFVNINN